ncbi:unnamed protein product, partial [Mesorhabditis belari]|uniref:Uncharacterized protein n=1 Tax=Mesorhabditis belari TaxID=2138241 RepID=A0AAF3JBD4_9BILA
MLVADSRGLFSYIFTDLGQQFRIDDSNGEQPQEFHIEHIDRGTGDVTTLENVMHGLVDGDFVTFTEVKGMVQINECQPIKVTVKKPHIFNIGNAAADFDAHTESGRGRQVKVASYVDYKPLAEALRDPEIAFWDFARMEYPQQLHQLFQALYAFEEKHGRSPKPRCDDDAALLKEELPADSEVDASLLKMFSYQATGMLVNVCSVVGGIAAQEAMKAVTHHMTPLKQFLYLDHVDALPGDWNSFNADLLTYEDCAPRGNRYDGQAAVFGWQYQETIGRQKWFIVGAGAIGCELLKNLAMMGVSSGKDGLIKITDMDQIEISNLNRQFLFRRPDVGEKKSVVAARAVKSMAERVGPDNRINFQ